MTIERPMFPPRAESTDSFFPQTAIGQLKHGNRASESCKPAEGLSRRTALVGFAMLPVAQCAVGIPIATAGPTPDPAFMRIAEKLAADIAHCEVIDAQDEAETHYEYGSAVVEEAWQRCCDACSVVNEADWRLATTPPTTLAGVAAVLRFANAIEDGGMEWPATDTVGSEGWHYQLRATIALAIETIIRQAAGGLA